jgi:hypothetical protein
LQARAFSGISRYPKAVDSRWAGRLIDLGEKGLGVRSEVERRSPRREPRKMDATTRARREVQSDNDYYRVTRWILPAGATTGPDVDEHRATILPSAPGKLLLKKQGREQRIDAVAGQPLEIERGTSRELVNRSEHDLTFTMIEFK